MVAEAKSIAQANGVGLLDLQHPPPLAGVPDLAFFLPTGRVLFREIKPEDAELEDTQKQHFGRMMGQGCDVDIWRPLDFRNGRVKNELTG